MSHVDEGTLHALVDNALDAGERSAVEAHLASCGECARRFAEATAMARQIVTLLGALDEPAPRVRIEPPATVAPSRAASPMVMTARRGVFTLRRVALAASVLLVAGVSYEVGRDRESAPVLESAAKSARLPDAPASMRAVPSVVDAATDSFVAAPAPSLRQRPRGGPRSDAEIVLVERGDSGATQRTPLGFRVAVSPVAAMPAAVPVTGAGQGASQSQAASPSQPPSLPQAQRAVEAAERAQKGPPPATTERLRVPREQALDQVVVTGASAPAAETRGAAASPKATSFKAIALPGYAMTEDSLVAPTTRRRYFSPTGTALELLVTPSTAVWKASAGQRNVAEFVVTTENGRSAVRWQARGMDYVLEGLLAPDSLMKLAIRLKS